MNENDRLLSNEHYDYDHEGTFDNHDQEERDASAVTYEDAITETGYGRFHYMVLALCGWAVSSDAVEVLSVSFLLPSATCDFNLNSSEKGWLNAVIFIGMMIGGYVWGSLADHYGRRQVLLGSLTLNGLGALASSVCQSYWPFLAMRLISGIGVGGSIPVIFSYFTEFQPKEKRGTMISILATFWMFGNIIAAGLAWIIVPLDIGFASPSFSYKSWKIFVAVCTIPSLSSAAIFFLFPESPKFLLSVGKEDEALAVLKKIYNTNKPGARGMYNVNSLKLTTEGQMDIQSNRITDNEQKCCHNAKSVRNILDSTEELFRVPLRKSTILMSIITFTISFGYYGLWLWFPELFKRVEKYGGSPCDSSVHVNISNTTDSGFCEKPDHWVFFSGFMTALSNLPGNLFTIFLMDKLGRKLILVIGMLGSGVSVFFIPFIHNKVQNLGLSCVFGAVSTLGWNALDVLQSELFPTNVRSTAIGVLTGMARIAAVLGNVTFGELVDVHCAVPMLIVAALLVFGGLSSLKLPNTTKVDIH